MRARVLRSVDGGVRRLAWSPDGELLAWGTDLGGVGIDLADGFIASELDAGAGVTDLQWSADSERLAVATESGTVVVWGLAGDVRLLDHRDWCGALAWDGAGLLAVGTGQDVIVYGPDLEPSGRRPFVGGAVNALAFVDGRLAVGSRGGITWLDRDAWEHADPLRFHNPGSVVALAWDGRRMLASGDALGALRIADVDSGDEWAIEGFPDAVDRVAWCGDMAVVAAEDELTMWGVGSDGVDELPFRLTGHSEVITTFAVRRARIASGDEVGTLILWPLGLIGEPLMVPVRAPIAALDWHPRDGRLTVGTGDGRVLSIVDRR